MRLHVCSKKETIHSKKETIYSKYETSLMANSCLHLKTFFALFWVRIGPCHPCLLDLSPVMVTGQNSSHLVKGSFLKKRIDRSSSYQQFAFAPACVSYDDCSWSDWLFQMCLWHYLIYIVLVCHKNPAEQTNRVFFCSFLYHCVDNKWVIVCFYKYFDKTLSIVRSLYTAQLIERWTSL